MIATEAGKRFHLWLANRSNDVMDVPEAIIDIETEATAQERERILQDARFHHGRLHEGEWELCCQPICYGVQLLAMEGWMTSEPKPW